MRDGLEKKERRKSKERQAKAAYVAISFLIVVLNSVSFAVNQLARRKKEKVSAAETYRASFDH